MQKTRQVAVLQRASSFMDGGNGDIKLLLVGLVDSRTLLELKCVSRWWRGAARHELLSRLCRCEGQPVPTQSNGITDLDVECLAECDRMYEVVAARRMLPSLARLRGYGFKVLLTNIGNMTDPEHELRRCVTGGQGEPPLALLLAAIACAATGNVWNVPVRLLREDMNIGHLNLSRRNFLYLRSECIAAQLLGMLLSGSRSVISIKCAAHHWLNPSLQLCCQQC